jgi:hypothetical protein
MLSGFCNVFSQFQQPFPIADFVRRCRPNSEVRWGPVLAIA